jgi:hypothetical protein
VTIILSVVTAEYGVRVSDRLLTRKWTTSAGVYYEPSWDQAANKSVIVLGRDGLFSMGYTGPGHIEGSSDLSMDDARQRSAC